MREFRTARDLSQAQLGAPHFTRAMLSAVELGKILPSLKSLAFLADRLEVPLSWLLPGSAGAQATHAFGAASVIVAPDGRVLLVRHNYGPHNWEIPGGVSAVGESAEETARREAREEIGVELEVEALTGVYWEPAWCEIGGHHFVLRARLAAGAEPRATDLREIADLGWFVPDAYPRPISDFTIARIRDALSGAPASVHEVGARTWLQ